MKLTKLEWDAFWKQIEDQWYMEDSSFPYEDCDKMPDTFDGDAVLCFHGSDPDKFNRKLFRTNDVDCGVAFSVVVRRWRKLQNTTTMVIQVPKSKTEAVIEALRALGIKPEK